MATTINASGLVPRHGINANVPVTTFNANELITTDDTFEIYIADSSGVAHLANTNYWWIPKNYILNLGTDGDTYNVPIGDWLWLVVTANDASLSNTLRLGIRTTESLGSVTIPANLTLTSSYDAVLSNSGIDTVAFDNESLSNDALTLRSSMGGNSNEMCNIYLHLTRPDNTMFDYYHISITSAKTRAATVVIVTKLAEKAIVRT